MKIKKSKRFILGCLLLACMNHALAQERPNILWITSEDNSPLLGCYGDTFATTPHLDKFATQGFLYTHAYANAPVCAPSRNTIASGIYASSGGHANMRSYYPRSSQAVFHAEALKMAGYYCTNNVKTDYNTNVDKEIWDDCSSKAHFKNAPAGQPWFAIFNSTVSHESQIHKQIPVSELKHDPKKVPIAPYHPRTPDMERDWAQYYDRVQQMDAFVGDVLRQLEQSGLAENTIVIYYSDHGGVLGRSKRYLYETGTHVPFIVRIPEKYKQFWPAPHPNSTIDRIISFVDLYPTLLNLAGAEIPPQLQGKAFLGKNISAAPKYAYMFRDRMDEWYDMSRAVRSNKYRYIRNYMPHRVYALPIEYLFRAKSLQSWRQAYQAGNCNAIQSAFWKTKPAEELYDTEHDPWEINNLAGNPTYAGVLKEMRAVNRTFLIRIKDTGFMPEDERNEQVGDKTIYDYYQSGGVNIEQVINAAEIASLGKIENIEKVSAFLSSDNPSIRYWGATGLLILGNKAKAKIPELKKAILDSSVSVSSVAAEALYKLGDKEHANIGFLKALKTDREFAQTLAINAIYLSDDNDELIKDEVLNVVKRMQVTSGYNYRAAMNLVDKWNLKVANQRKQ